MHEFAWLGLYRVSNECEIRPLQMLQKALALTPESG